MPSATSPFSSSAAPWRWMPRISRLRSEKRLPISSAVFPLAKRFVVVVLAECDERPLQRPVAVLGSLLGLVEMPLGPGKPAARHRGLELGAVVVGEERGDVARRAPGCRPRHSPCRRARSRPCTRRRGRPRGPPRRGARDPPARDRPRSPPPGGAGTRRPSRADELRRGLLRGGIRGPGSCLGVPSKCYKLLAGRNVTGSRKSPPRITAWSRCTSPKASKSAGRRRGRPRVSTRRTPSAAGQPS